MHTYTYILYTKKNGVIILNKDNKIIFVDEKKKNQKGFSFVDHLKKLQEGGGPCRPAGRY